MFAYKRQEWRKHPALSFRSNVKHMFTGFGTAAVLFGIYWGLEYTYYTNLYKKDAEAEAAATAAAAAPQISSSSTAH
ncbi:hypothetical protein FVE85_3665 [Porphyridium purpureum]|uniref:Uncharacterized protein n=1 Tax=Porphyridium purpureum TaxID=35688 RepID=A0A5J4YP89_PORPP|nr:hypothetical protein FVE85_3665 [Porphyridium purpureum]|eukprot:POR0006..scf249_10